ncbi:MAG TPA: MAPEG family protein [Kofleriaceae bacterium]|jgi:uncharacterized MAPEG superfamily protein|nr:MAPEG family protein [Kofleriaceae bacterium]
MQHVPYICLLYAFILIYAPRFGPVNVEQAKLPGGYDNRDPRGQQTQLTGLGKRALGAHMNGFEAFAPFAIALLVAAGSSSHFNLVCYIGIGFCVVRTIYLIAYLGDNASLRSGMWGLGLIAVSALFVLAIIGR